MKYIHLLSTLLITSLAQIFWRQKKDFANVRSVVAKEGDTITFNFDVDEVTVKWFYDEDPPQFLISDEKKFKLHKDGSLTIKTLDVADSGQYKAEVEIMGNVADVIFKLNVLGFKVIDVEGASLNKDIKQKTYYRTDPLLDNLGVSIKYNADFSKCYMLNTNLPGNDLKKYTYFDSTISNCQLHCFETPGCSAFVYIKRNMETGASNECVLKSGENHERTKMVGFTSATKNCLIVEDGRCYKRGYSLHTNGNFLFREKMSGHMECQERCLSNKECRTFSYNTIDRMCTFDKYVDAKPVFNNSDIVVSDKGCIRNTDRSCFNEGYGSPGEDIATIPKVYSIGQCILKCLENEECQIFIFLNLGDTMKDHCLLKRRPTDLISKKIRILNGAVSGDIECMKSRGEQCYYLKRKSNDESLIYLKRTASDQYGCENQCMVDDKCEAFTYKPRERECSRLSKIPRSLTKDALYNTGLKECLVQAAGGMKVQAVCEMNEKTLTCPPQQYLHIIYASWGRTDDWVCSEGSNNRTDCKGINVQALMMIRDECNGKNSCRLRADPEQLGNFCPGTTKYLKVVYTCSPVKVITTTNCENEVNELKCENGEKVMIVEADFGRRTNKVCFKGDYCSNGNQERYRGHVRNSKSGKTCQSWAAQEPHKHDYFTPQKFPQAGLDENFCRNPNPKEDQAWCFTLDPKTRYEQCGIINCSSVPCHTDEMDATKRITQLCQGKESCTVVANVQTLGDPCPYIPKYLTIEYYCSRGRGSAIYDYSMPILDQPVVDIAVRHLDQIKDLPHSECYVLNIDYPRGNIRVIRDVPNIEDCRDTCLDNDRCNVFTYHVPSQRCTLKELPSLDVVDDIAGMISARKDCLELEETRKKRGVTVEHNYKDSEILDYREYLKATTVDYKEKPVIEDRIPQKKKNPWQREREYNHKLKIPHREMIPVKDDNNVVVEVVEKKP